MEVEVPNCKCGQPAELRTVRKEGPNHGRTFWGCPKFPDSSACGFFKWAGPQGTPGQQAAPYQSPPQHRQQQQWEHPLYPSPSQQPSPWRPGPSQQQQSPWQAGPSQQQQSPWQAGPSQQQQSPWRPGPSQQQQSPWQAEPSQQQQQWQSPQAQARGPAPRYGSPLALQQWQGAGADPPAAPSSAQPAWGGPPYGSSPAQGQSSGSQPGAGMYGPPPQVLQQQLEQRRQQHQQQWQQGAGYGGPPSQQGGSQPHAGQQGWGGAGPASPYRPPSQQQPGWGSPPGSQQLTQGSPAGSQRLTQGSPPAGSPGMGRLIYGDAQGDGPPVRVNMQVVNYDQLGVHFRYNEVLKDYLKALPQRPAWNPATKMWCWPLDEYEAVLDALNVAPVPVAISPIPPEALERARHGQEGEAGAEQVAGARVSDAEVQERLQRLPPQLWEKLYGFQQEGVRKGLAFGGRCLIADEMGLGKTVQALCIAACYPEDWPLLIVCPATMKLVWREAVRTWLPLDLKPSGRNLVVITDGKGIDSKLAGMDTSSPARVLIANYEMIKKLGQRAAAFGTVIVDESHHLKGLTAQRTSAVSELVKAARRAILCTGTPALSRPVELYSQIDMLRPGMFGSLDEFGQRYCDGRPALDARQATAPSRLDLRGASNLDELHWRLEQALMIRRLKKDVLDELPDKIRKRIPIEVDTAHRRELLQTEQEMAAVERAEQSGELSSADAAMRRQQLVTEYYRRTGPAKVKDVQAHLQSLLEAGEKVLVFAHHQAVLDELQAGLGRVPFVRIDGGVTNERRKEAVDRFQRDPHIRAALLSITAAGVGITLTEASVVVFAELYWNPGHLIQAEDRAHRLGQKRALEVHYLVARHSADDLIWKLCQRKLAIVGGAMGDAEAEEAFEAPASRRLRNTAERLAEQQQQQQQQHGQATQTASGEEVVVISDSEEEEGTAAAAGAAAAAAVPAAAPPAGPEEPAPVERVPAEAGGASRGATPSFSGNDLNDEEQGAFEAVLAASQQVLARRGQRGGAAASSSEEEEEKDSMTASEEDEEAAEGEEGQQGAAEQDVGAAMAARAAERRQQADEEDARRKRRRVMGNSPQDKRDMALRFL